MMNLNFFINTLDGGGAEKVLVDLVNQLPQDKYSVTVTTLLHGVHEKKLAPHVRHKCIISTRNHLLSFVIERIYCKLFTHCLFARLFLSGNYDVVISYLEGFNTHILASYKGKAKRVAFVHCNTGVDSGWAHTYPSLEDCLRQYNAFDRVCFISKDALDGFEKVVGHLSNANVVHNVIDLKSAIELSKQYDINPNSSDDFNGIKFISVGRLTKVKGYERLLTVISRLQTEGFDCGLTICGEGTERNELEALIEKKGISHIHLLGFQSNPYKYMVQADIYVCSSYSEGYSTSVAESIALGLPVLTTECSGMREILSDGEYGDIVENSEDGLYYGIKRILTDNEYLTKLKSRVSVRSQELLSMNPLKEYIELFESL